MGDGSRSTNLMLIAKNADDACRVHLSIILLQDDHGSMLLNEGNDNWGENLIAIPHSAAGAIDLKQFILMCSCDPTPYHD